MKITKEDMQDAAAVVGLLVFIWVLLILILSL